MSDDVQEELLRTINELREENKELREGEEKPDPPSNDEIVDQFIGEMNYSESTATTKVRCIEYLRRHTDEKPLTEITEREVLDWGRNWDANGDGGPNPQTMVHYLTRVKKLYDWMIDERDWAPDENPATGAVKKFRKGNTSAIRRSGKHSGTVLKPHEFAAVVRRNTNKRRRAILVVAVKTGLRRSELVEVKIDDVDLDEQKLYNHVPKGMGGERLPRSDADHKILDDETVGVLEDWFERRQALIDSFDRKKKHPHSAGVGFDGEGYKPDTDWLFPNCVGGQLSGGSVYREFDKATERAANAVEDDDPKLAEKLRDFSPHDARRCFTSWLNWNNCPRDIIKALRGDADGDMISLYTKHGEEQVREEYEAAMPSLGL